MTEKFDIIVLAGQSNAVGYGVGDVEEEYIPSENIMWLEDDADAHFEKNEVTGKDELMIHYPSTFCISVAEEPLSANGQKLGKPAILFAKNYYDTYLKGTDRKVLIINAAVGGTGFARNEWGVENAVLYTRLCDMVNYALGQNKDNKLAAFLWHQGECDAFENAEWDAEKRYTVHKRNLLLMFGDFKKKFNCPHIPMVTGEFCNEWYEENKIPCDAVLRAVCEVFSAENNGACVKTADLLSNNQATGNGDNIHFCRPAAYELGRRYFEAYRQLKK